MSNDSKRDFDFIDEVIGQQTTKGPWSFIDDRLRTDIKGELHRRAWWDGPQKWLYGFKKSFQGALFGIGITTIFIYFLFPTNNFNLGFLFGFSVFLLIELITLIGSKFNK
jgi:hypothetical protein